MGNPAFEPERVLAGRYRLERRLGGGGMGAIWRAEHLTLQAPVAVKLIDRDAVPDEDMVSRFLREAKAAAALRSPHVVQILDYGMDEGVPFIVMELLEGENLSERLKRVGRLSPHETTNVITHVGRAVGRAHEAGVVHRDLKPENVFLVHNEDDEIAKVLDFGVAKIERGVLKEGTRTRTGSILGTPYYMSPEQAQGNKAVDYRSDLWSLAVIAFECLVGKRPFHSEGLGDLVLQICVRDIPVPSQLAAVPPGFDDWFARAVARDPELRFQSARVMTETLREALGIDPRETSALAPEFVVGSSPEELRIARSRDADANASTVALEPEEVRRLAQSGVGETEEDPARPAAANQSSSDTDALSVVDAQDIQSPLPDEAWKVLPSRAIPVVPVPPPRSSAGTIVAVAAAALALGMAGGLVALWQLRTPASEFSFFRSRAPEPVPIVGQPAPGSMRGQVLPQAVPSAVPAASTASQPSSDSAPPQLADEPASPQGAASSVVRPKRDAETDRLDAGSAAPRGPDGEWVKPEWAIPDEEPRKMPDLMQE